MKPRAEFQEEQARVLAASLRGPRLGWTEEAMIAGSRYLVCLLPLLGLSPGKKLLLLSAFNNRFASKELQVARLTYCGFVEKTSVGFIPDASEGTYSPKH
ncbi:unnamed protein product [Brassica oleracea]|uniref:Uncharacterized protein n=2 Tax=Brassica oleracea TaxID=3712 RepID=A0A0D3EB92_BRAOL|nr:unnamed protein product [Brassica oleracea]